MRRLRDLADVRIAAQQRGLRPIASLAGDVVFLCPFCDNRQRASVLLLDGALVARCFGCRSAGDDEQDIVEALQPVDRLHGDQFEIALRVFDLWLALEGQRRSTPTPVRSAA